MMQTTPNGNRKHIVLYGKTNSGKSSLFNKLLGQELAVVSSLKGTTTDPVSKAMELLPVGPVLFIDTAGVGDDTALGQVRMQKTLDMMPRTDLAIYVVDATDSDLAAYFQIIREFKRYNIPYIVVLNKIDCCKGSISEALAKISEKAIKVSTFTGEGIEQVKEALIQNLQQEDEQTLMGGLVPYGGSVILVAPIDSEAPKGRLILPQVQCIRDCLDHGIRCQIVRETELQEALKSMPDVDLVITDSQIFKQVDQIVPPHIKLTSFSILLAKQKGDIVEFIKGTQAIRNLTKNARILICESCTHNVSHEDIGRVKIPKMLNKYVKEELEYTFKVGHDFVEKVDDFDLVIHCGGCMVNRKTIMSRIRLCQEKQVPITNYGIVLAFLTGILDRSVDSL